jgi:dihydroneopterin aldolase
MIVEIHGLEVFGRHGIGGAERRDGQSFLFDVTLNVSEPEVDAIDAAVDYRAVRECVRETSDAASYKLLESLAGATAEAIAARFPAAHSVTVRVRKPGVAWAEWTSATASRPSSSPR